MSADTARLGRRQRIVCDGCGRKMRLPWRLARRLGWSLGGAAGYWDHCPGCAG